MSTYGKKALTHWEYEKDNDIVRFNATPHNIQEEILKKWYPIGFTCEKTSKVATEYYGSFTITKHVKMPYGWRVELKGHNQYDNGYESIVYTGILRPSKEWRREEKLKELGI
jgi:hypothetical protein